MKVKELPKELYVYIEEDGEDSYAVAFRVLEECGDIDEPRTVGRYRLAESGTLKMEPVYKSENV